MVDINTELYEKMVEEQDKYRDWLKSQPPEEIINHAYEYSMREDIVMAMEEMELSPKRAEALLNSPAPVDDVLRLFWKLETDHMDTIRDTIERRADQLIKLDEWCKGCMVDG